MTTSENRRWAFAGPLAVALWVVGIILLNHNGPADHATGSQILAWYKSDSDTIVLGGWLFMLGCLGFVTFVAGLRVRLAEAAGPASQLPALALVGAAMAGLSGMLTAAVDLAGGIDKNDIEAATAATFHHAVEDGAPHERAEALGISARDPFERDAVDRDLVRQSARVVRAAPAPRNAFVEAEQIRPPR